MVASTVTVEKSDSHGDEHHHSNNYKSTTNQNHAQPQEAAAHAPVSASPSVPAVNVWNARKEAMKPATSNPEAEAEKRVESIIENIKEVTLGKSEYLFSSKSSTCVYMGLMNQLEGWWCLK